MESARDGLMRREAHPGTEGLPAMRSDRFPPDEGEHCRGTARDGSADATILPGNEKKSSRARRRLDYRGTSSVGRDRAPCRGSERREGRARW